MTISLSEYRPATAVRPVSIILFSELVPVSKLPVAGEILSLGRRQATEIRAAAVTPFLGCGQDGVTRPAAVTPFLDGTLVPVTVARTPCSVLAQASSTLQAARTPSSEVSLETATQQAISTRCLAIERMSSREI